jgi:hypothetical protein
MERGSIVLIDPVPRIERQEFDFGSFGQIGRLVDDKSPALHSSLQRHSIRVASPPLLPQGTEHQRRWKAGRSPVSRVNRVRSAAPGWRPDPGHRSPPARFPGPISCAVRFAHIIQRFGPDSRLPARRLRHHRTDRRRREGTGLSRQRHEAEASGRDQDSAGVTRGRRKGGSLTSAATCGRLDANFEMLTDTRAFEGEDVSEALAAVLRGEPNWNALPANIPSAIRTLIRAVSRQGTTPPRCGYLGRAVCADRPRGTRGSAGRTGSSARATLNAALEIGGPDRSGRTGNRHARGRWRVGAQAIGCRAAPGAFLVHGPWSSGSRRECDCHLA